MPSNLQNSTQKKVLQKNILQRKCLPDSKQVIVGCGGGLCQQPYSPVAFWMEDTDVALNDEGQQYGNLDEASAIARAPRKCLVIWCGGDHKQTPGGLRKTDEAKAFRRKLLRRPIALRGDTEHFQPNMLGKVVLRYLEGMDEPLIKDLLGSSFIRLLLSTEKSDLCLCQENEVAVMPAQDVTLHSHQAEGHLALQPINRSSNVCGCMHIG